MCSGTNRRLLLYNQQNSGKPRPPHPRSMLLDFLRPGVRSGFECLRGRRHARPSVPTTGTNTPETLNGGCGGSVAFLLVLIVEAGTFFKTVQKIPKSLSSTLPKLVQPGALRDRAEHGFPRLLPRLCAQPATHARGPTPSHGAMRRAGPPRGWSLSARASRRALSFSSNAHFHTQSARRA